MPKQYYKDPVTKEFKEIKPVATIPKEIKDSVNQLTRDLTKLDGRVTNLENGGGSGYDDTELRERIESAETTIDEITEEYGSHVADINPATGVGYFVGGNGYIAGANPSINTSNSTGTGYAYIKVSPSTEYTVAIEPSEGYALDGAGIYIGQYRTQNISGFINRLNPRGSLSYTFVTDPATEYLFVSAYMSPNTSDDSDGNKIHIYATVDGGGVTAVDKVAREYIDAKDPLYGEIPEYFKGHVDDKCEQIVQNMRSVGREGFTFAFISDVHWSNNAKNSPALIRYIAEKTGVNVLINGGDNITSGSLAEMIEQENEVTDIFNAAIRGDYLMTMGNHDSNRNGHGGDNSYWMTYQEIYATEFCYTPNNAVFRNQAYPAKTASMPCHDYYYDIPKLKIRIVSIDTMGIANLYDISYAWLKNLLANDDGYKYVIAIHAMYNVVNGQIKAIYDSQLDDFYAKINPYASKILCILTGHTHVDGAFMLNASTTSNGTIPVIMNDTDGFRNLNSINPNTATEGTISEQCFDVITVSTVNGSVKCVRIGRGSNREITHG